MTSEDRADESLDAVLKAMNLSLKSYVGTPMLYRMRKAFTKSRLIRIYKGRTIATMPCAGRPNE